MQTIKREEIEEPSNTKTRELFLDASTSEAPSDGMMEIEEEEVDTEESRQESTVEED